MRAVRKVLTLRGTVLVVDDDQHNLSLVRKILRANDFGVRTTDQGWRALRVAREVQPALILLNPKLQELDGQAILKQLKKVSATQDIPVILMTGSAIIDRAKQEKILTLRSARFMTRSFSVEELIEEFELVL